MASLVHVGSILTTFVRLLLSLGAWNILDASAQGETLKYVGKMSVVRRVPEGSSVDLSCELNDPSVAVKLWQMLGSGAMYTPRKNVVHYGQLFTLHRVNNNMQGTYICRVKKRTFSQNIGMIYLKPSPKDPPKPTVDARQKVILVNRDVSLTCQATGTRISNVQWYQRARPLSMQQQAVSKELNLDGETWINTLMLKNVRIHQAGWYECRVFEKNEAFGFWSTHVKLNVIDKTECPELDGTFADPQRTTGYLNCSGGVSTRMNCSKGLVWRDDKKACDKPAPVIKWETTHHSLRLIRKTVGDSVILNCRMSDPNVRVKLKQKVAFGVIRERFTDGCRVSRVGQTFVVHAVNFKDVGIYYCEAPHLKIRRKEEAYLKVQPAPSSAIYQGYRNLFVSVGSSLDLNCGAPNIFQPFIFLEIIRMDGITQLTPDGHRVTLTGRVVSINGTDRSMRGRVVCKVISSCNQAQEDVDLGNLLPVPLKGTPPIPEISQQLSVVNKGESLNITCSVSGGEGHSISWFKNKEPVSVNLVFSSAFRSILMLNNISKSDAGDYECRTINFGNGYWLKTATVMVKDASTAFYTATPSTTSPSMPPKQVVPSVIEIVPYQAVDVVCRMFQADLAINLWQESTPGTFIQRIADGVAITRQENIFTITQARQNDKGTYYCEAANSKKILAAVLTFPDDKPPKIFNFTTKAAVNASQNVKLFCGTEGEPPFADVQWFKNDVSVGRCKGELQQNKTCVLDLHHRKYSISWRGSGAELMIKNVFHPFDTGDFTCVAVNTIGMDNKTVHLDIYEKPVLNKKNDTDFRVLSFRDATMIQSTALRGHPIPHFKWFQQRIEICASGCKPDAKRWRRVPRHVINPSEQVPSRISSLFLPPGKKGYFFRCIAENSLGHDDVVFSVHRIDMETVLPEIIPSTPFQRVDEGSRLTMLCQASTGDFLHLAWQRRSSPQELPTILTRNKHNITCTLTIEHAQMEDAGDYVCYGYGWTANDTKISVITLTVTEFVLPVVSLSNQTIQEEKTNSTILTCLISSGYPAPNITWYKDGKRLSLHALRSSDHCRINGFYYMEKHGPPFAKDLVICKPSHVENTGFYKCEAKNSKGIASSEAFLNVLAHPKIFNMVDHKLPKELGEKVNVSCKATGNPIPSVNWVKKTASDGRHVPVTHVDLKNHTLRINSLLEEHYGDYMCLAKNKFGNDTVVLSLVKPGLVGAAKDKPSSNVSLIIAIVVSVALFLVLLLIAAIFYRRRQLYGGFYICTTPPLPDMIPRLDSSIPLIEQVNKLPYDKRWEFPREQLHFDKVLGSGAFGAVYLAEAEGSIISDNTSTKTSRHRLSTVRDSRRGSTMSQGPIKVAVKTLKERAEESEHKDLISELKILIHIGSHKNIVNLLAACTKGRYSDICVIIEYCPHGNMLQFLRRKREMYNPIWLPPTEDPDKQFSMTDVVSAAFQVARAMEFLASRKCVHRDLAARNVLVGENYVVKVADFGLARDVYKDDTYIKVSPGLVPVKWMAIESLTDRVYSEQSDVWSFGVFVWELFTLGGNPYPNLPPTEIYRYIVEGNRMERPVDCPEEVYAMMRDCWMERPADRPNFTALVQRLDHVIESNIAAMGREGYLELGDDSVMPSEETDDDGYLRPREIVPPGYKAALLNVNSESNRDLQGSNRSLTNESKSKGLIHERYTELGFKPPNNATDLTETVL